ncbi:unnamed protein product [Mucor hiemalis]
MPTITDIPPEILVTVFRLIPKKELYASILFVSKSWYALAASVYYETVELVPSKIRYLNEILMVNHGSDAYFRTLPFTKTLRIYSGGNSNSLSSLMDPQVFPFILSLFPKLNEIHFADYGSHRLYYVKLLLGVSVSLLPCLEKITVAHDAQFREDLYFEAQYKFRRTLKHVHLLYNFDSQFVFQRSILSMLSEFESLEELVFVNEKLPLLTLFTLLETCPNLHSLTFKSKFDVAEEDVSGYLNHVLQAIDRSDSTPSMYFGNLKALVITIPYFTESYINYLIEHCPASLRQLEITFTEEDFYNWIEDISLDTVLRLAERMSKVLKAKIASDQSVGCTKREGVPREDSKINVFHKVLSALQGKNPSKKCIGLYQDTNYPGVSLLSDKTTSYVGYDYFLDHKDYGIDKKDKGEDLVRYTQIPVPDLGLIAGPSTTTEIRFMIQRAYFVQLPTVQLKHAEKYFTQLNCFQAKYLVPTCKMIATQRDTRTKSRLSEMTSCELKGASLSQQSLDDLALFFPKLEILKYEIANYSQPSRKLKDFMYINLSKMYHLKGFILELKDMVLLQQRHMLFFDVSFTDRKESPAFFTLAGWKMDDPEPFGQFQQVTIDTVNQFWDDPHAGVFIVTIEIPIVEDVFQLIFGRHDARLGLIHLTRHAEIQ